MLGEMNVVHSVFFEKWEALGFKTIVEPECITLVSHIPHWSCNKVLFLHNTIPPALIATKKRLFFELQLPFSFLVLEEGPMSLPQEMKLTCMERTLASWKACQTNAEVIVRKVKSPQEFYEFCLVVDDNFPMSPAAKALYNHHLLQLKEHQVLLYTGYIHNDPVSSGMLFLGETYASLYFIGTRFSARGKGAAFSLLQTCLTEAKERGYTKASLSATESARSLYEKVGFEKRMIEMRIRL